MSRGRKRTVRSTELKGAVVPVVKDVLALVGAAGLIGASVVIPAVPVVVTPIIKYVKGKLDEEEEINNSKFDKARLSLLLRRLEKQRDVKLIKEADGSIVVSLTDKGRIKYFRYKLEEMPENISRRSWDGKWRMVIYDVPEKERGKRDVFRLFLNSMKFYKLQNSVYLAPYACENEMEYFRRYYELGKKVQILVVEGLEDDEAYRRYFGIR
ncbi:CRISPR-associated endonuclease Cas2 [Candidatus Gottesmanbacteria bacterium RIFCSPHIGHO2_01_FULL_47_48]|uniref:CRISPR-associated endonuclease Cas2 n=1 Tax=Candidatus Gottesmanbacteria bacterium RIFCSPHIGHO2_01_FULL_47_48 TaxID=1798381 RepID=A0A1F6A114_9BACT|nr:MAG: CRISPR-associated endonuclease Cas2 [Candidatus Gottesmanbacteria bacterium RIFCSPHIGHO2_01_FULL_47_48]